MAPPALTNDGLITAFERRFDFVSARVMVKEALAAAGLGQKDGYEASDIDALIAALPKVADRTESVTEALRAAVAKPAAKAEAKPEAKEAPAKEALGAAPKAAKADDDKPADAPHADEGEEKKKKK